jgi:DNA-binding LacI/PurR family transcriptional regulator
LFAKFRFRLQTVSIKDVARAAHVSHSTVSRALRNSPLVNAETRALIHRIAAEKGYTVSAVGRSLVTRRTNTIGVLVTTIADPFACEVVSGIEEFALSHDYSVMLAASHSDADRAPSVPFRSGVWMEFSLWRHELAPDTFRCSRE